MYLTDLHNLAIISSISLKGSKISFVSIFGHQCLRWKLYAEKVAGLCAECFSWFYEICDSMMPWWLLNKAKLNFKTLRCLKNPWLAMVIAKHLNMFWPARAKTSLVLSFDSRKGFFFFNTITKVTTSAKYLSTHRLWIKFSSLTSHRNNFVQSSSGNHEV